MITRTEIAKILQTPPIDSDVTVMGWVRAYRGRRFIALYDGSTSETLQVVVDFGSFPEDLINKIKFHACISVTGTVIESQGSGQAVEIVAKGLEILGENNLEEYPLQAKKQTRLRSDRVAIHPKY